MEPKNKFSERNKKILATVAIMVIPAFAGSVLYTQYQIDKDKTSTPEDNELLEFIKKEQEYQNKITTFNPANYELPKTNLAKNDENLGCKSGIGGKMPMLYSGMFSEPLYHLDAEATATDIPGKFAYAPYVNAFYVVGDILFQQPLDLFDRQLVTTKSLLRHMYDVQIIVGNQSYTNSFNAMQTKFGFPYAYMVQQTGSVVSFSSFNNECAKDVARKNITYRKFDLTGLPVSVLLSADWQTSLHHGINGLFNFTEKTTDFVSENFLDWVQSNNRAYLDIVTSPETPKFEPGSYLYIPVQYENINEVVYVDYSQPLKDFSLEQWRKELAAKNSLPASEIEFVEENSGGSKVYKAFKAGNMEPVGDFVVGLKDKKWYMGKWELPYKTELSGKEPYRNQLVLLNEKAMGTAISLFKSRYQGKQVDANSDNENLDLRYKEAVSEKTKQDFFDKKQQLLDAFSKS